MDSIHAWIITLAALFGFGGEHPAQTMYFGYVEGEYVYVSPKQSGILDTLSVTRGDTVEAGQDLYTLDRDQQVIAVGQAEANLQMARAKLVDESTGQRPEEIAVIEEQLRNAEANLVLARADYDRSKELSVNDFVSTSQLDQAAATLEQAVALVGQQRAQLKVARLPARSAQLDEARQSVRASELAVDNARVELAERSLSAPAEGYVQQTYFLPGEFVQAGMPVVSILPPGQVKFRFFVSEPDRAKVTIGASVDIGCDQCGVPVRARVTYISSSAEYTPPVIYSLEERSKLVFMAEALPVGPTTLLPGQPIDVRPVP